jgi:branched-chain amino acid transport system permease protein
MSTGLQIIINGILIGGLWAILGLGKQVILGVLRFINFAHASFALIAMYVLYYLWNATGINPFVLVVPVVVLMGLLGLAIERPLIRPLVARGERSQMIATLALLTLIQALLNLLFGAAGHTVTSDLTTSGVHLTSGVFVTWSSLLIFVIALVAFGLVWLLLNRTNFGLKIRATSQKRASAVYCAINVRSVYGLAFALSIAIAGLVGALFAIGTPVSPTSAAPLLVLMFVVPILGGLGSIPGTLLGGFIVGILQGLTTQFLPPQLENAIIYLIFVLVLMVRPQGVLGDSARLVERST